MARRRPRDPDTPPESGITSADNDDTRKDRPGPKGRDAAEDDRLVKECHERFRYCEEYEGRARELHVEDTRFANADADNQWQWAGDLLASRQLESRPCLTVNITRQHNLSIVNDAKQNKPAIKLSPIGDGASYEAAQAYEGLVRHIEYVSNAQAAYDRAATTMVDGGVGYWRVVTDYIDSDSFDQEIYIRPIRDPLTVMLDPDAQQADRSDARWGIVFTDMERKLFERSHPDWKDYGSEATGATFGEHITWSTKQHVRVAEYWRKTEHRDRLVAFTGTDGPTTARASKLGTELVKRLLEDPTTKIRDVMDDKVEWFKIVGNTIVDRREWPGRYIPIVMVVGEETWVEGDYDRKGHTRALKDSQRLFNYMNSASAEYIALQSKSPWLTDEEAIEGYESYYDNANQENYARLPYRSKGEDGRDLQPPRRMDPPQAAQAYVQGMELAAQHLQQVSGQYEAQMGQPSNERSGIAIQQRQRQGDRATYHYVDGVAVGIRYTGVILIDLIPKIYDSERVALILDENGTKRRIAIAPGAKQALTDTSKDNGVDVDAIFNPNVGRYEVQADSGPGWATRRQEAFNAFSQIATSNSELMQVAGDLMFRAADFPMADELAERLKRLVPPAALGEGPTPGEQQAQQQVTELQGKMQAGTALLEAMQTRLQKAELALKGKSEKRDIEAFDAETRRMAALAKQLGVEPEGLKAVVRQLMMEALQTPLSPVIASNAPSLDFQSDAITGNEGQPVQ